MENRIVELRKKAGLRQADIAKELGIVQSAVSAWETGQGNPRIEHLPKLAEMLHCTIDEIFRTAHQ